MRTKNSNKLGFLDAKWLILIFCLGFILRLFFALNSRDPIIKDGATYDSVAMSLTGGKGFTLDGEHPTSSVPPLYPFFLFLIYSIFGHNFQAALIIQAVLGAITCLLIFLLAREIFKDRKTAILSGAICAVYYYFIREGERLWTEPLFIFLVILLVFSYLRLITARSIAYAILFGISSAALVLTRPVALFLPLIFVAVEFLRGRYWQKGIFFSSIRYLAVAMVFFIVPIGLWAGRNSIVQKEFVLVATGGGRNFYESFNPYEGKKYGITVIDETIRRGDNLPTEASKDRFYFEEGVKSISKKSWAELLRLIVLRAATFWSLMDWGAMGNGMAVFNFCTSFILPFSLIGLILSRRNKLVLICFVIPITYFFLFSMLFMGLPRFRLPIEPFLVALASYGIVRFFRKFTNKAIPSFVILAWLCFNFTLFINSGYTKELFKRIANLSGIW